MSDVKDDIETIMNKITNAMFTIEVDENGQKHVVHEHYDRLDIRGYGCKKREDIDISKMTVDEALKMRNLSRKQLEEILAKIKEESSQHSNL